MQHIFDLTTLIYQCLSFHVGFLSQVIEYFRFISRRKECHKNHGMNSQMKQSISFLRRQKKLICRPGKYYAVNFTISFEHASIYNKQAQEKSNVTPIYELSAIVFLSFHDLFHFSSRRFFRKELFYWSFKFDSLFLK